MNSCWATHTGVTGGTGFAEAQILAGQSALTHILGDVTITTPNAVIDHEWISGCVAIAPGANNVTIRDSLITPHGHTCSGGGGGSQSSAVNDGQSSSSPAGLLIEDTTVDGSNVGDYGVSIVNGSCIRCNIFGFVDNFWSGGSSVAAPSLFQDSYSHDMATGLVGDHEQALNFMGASYVTIEHSYAIADAGNGYITGALNLQDWQGSGPTHITADRNYLEGVHGVDLIGSCTSTYNRISNNAFSHDNGYGGIDYFSYFATQRYKASAVGNTWRGNYVAEAPNEAAPPPSGDPGRGGC